MGVPADAVAIDAGYPIDVAAATATATDAAAVHAVTGDIGKKKGVRQKSHLLGWIFRQRQIVVAGVRDIQSKSLLILTN